jgi:excisionase family DNA binding protein
MLKRCGIRHIELRSILGTNILDLTDAQVTDLKALLDREGIRLSALGSPIGKVAIDEPFAPHLVRFQRALELCKVFETPNMRIFSYYPGRFADWEQWRGEVMYRMRTKARLASRGVLWKGLEDMAESPEVMNIRQASQYLGVSPDTLYKYVYEEKIPAFKLGNRWKFKKTILDQWMEQQSTMGDGRGKKKPTAAGRAVVAGR